MTRIGLIATILIAAVPWIAITSAAADCASGEEVIFQCDVAGEGDRLSAGTRVSICLAGEHIHYSFGAPTDTPRTTFVLPVTVPSVEISLWEGIGRYINESVTLKNGADTYIAGYSVDRLDPSCEMACRSEGSLRVMTQAGAEVVHSCEPISVEQRIHRLSTILEPPPEASCEDAVTTVEMMACVRHDLAAAEARMEALLEDLSERADDEGLRLLTAAQDAWGAYRDAECDRRADLARGGTMAPLLRAGCLIGLTEERVEGLSFGLEAQ